MSLFFLITSRSERQVSLYLQYLGQDSKFRTDRKNCFPSGSNTTTQQTDGMNLWQYAKTYYPENFIYQPVLTGADDPLPNYVTENPVSYLYAGGRSVTSRRKTILSISPEFTILPKILKIKADLSFTPTSYQKEKTHPKQARVNYSWTALETR